MKNRLLALSVAAISAAFISGCEATPSPVAPSGASGSVGSGVTMKKPGGGKGGGGGHTAVTFEWEVAGTMFAEPEGEALVQEGFLDPEKDRELVVRLTNSTGGVNDDNTLNLDFLFDVPNGLTCFGNSVVHGVLYVDGEGVTGVGDPLVGGHNFRGSNQDGSQADIRYNLLMEGTLASGGWLPELDGAPSVVTLTSWEISTEKKDRNKTPCAGGGLFNTEVRITRTQ